MARTVIAVFDSLYSASNAIADLEENGISKESLRVFSRSVRGSQAGQVKKKERLKVRPEVEVDGQKTGARIGGSIGVAAAVAAILLAAFGIIQMPFLTQIFTSNLVAGAGVWLAWISVFAAAGSLPGLLMGGALGLGIPEAEIRQYARIACNDDVILAVLADWNDIDTVIQLVGKHAPLTIEEKAYNRSIEEQITSRQAAKHTSALNPREREDHR